MSACGCYIDLREDFENENRGLSTTITATGGGGGEGVPSVESWLKPILMEQLSDMNRAIGVGLQKADAAYQLNELVGGKQDGRGAMLLKQGASLLVQAKHLLACAVAEIYK